MTILENQIEPLPTIQDLVCLLQRCRKEKDGEIASRLCTYLQKNGLERQPTLGNPLISFLVEVGSVHHAQEVFEGLKCEDKDERSWNILITGHVKHGNPQFALSLYEQMRKYPSLQPSGYSYAALLRACGSLRDWKRGTMIHCEVVRKGLLERDAFIGSTLVDMYAKHGSLERAQEVFDRIPFRDIVIWTTLIAALVEQGNGHEALRHIRLMQQEGIVLDAVTFICGLKACSFTGSIDKAHLFHSAIIKQGLEGDLILGSTLIDTYAKCSLPYEAREVFNNLVDKDMISWTAMITCYTDCGFGEESLHCLEHMQREGFSPNVVTLLSGIRACICMGSLIKGQEIHCDVIKRGFERDLLIGSTLVDMYSKCSFLLDAHAVLDKLPSRNTVSWTALVAGYIEHGYGEQALYFFDKMQEEGFSPCIVTFICVLKACASIGAVCRGQELHAEIARKGLLEKEVCLGSILVDMYAKCGLLVKAEEILKNLDVKNEVSWTSLIGGYVEHGGNEDALRCFEQMQRHFVAPAPATYVCVVKACINEGCFAIGQEIHKEIVMKSWEAELLVGNALIDMYVKSGLLLEAQDVFEQLEVRDVISWTSLISGYTKQGKVEEAFYLLNKMIAEGSMPNLATFGSLLSACSHTGHVERSQLYLEALSNGYGYFPTLEHCSSMVDLLCRAGHVDKAAAMISRMPFSPGSVAWHSLLGACQKWGDLQLGSCTFDNARVSDRKGYGAYICMSNIHNTPTNQDSLETVSCE
ncbi:hypothetical protein KP509_1Z090000 [Ceratopteris richardii]|nr:hypothetical protein KP509_1Z090000 [Ceratopteris richardii]